MRKLQIFIGLLFALIAVQACAQSYDIKDVQVANTEWRLRGVPISNVSLSIPSSGATNAKLPTELAVFNFANTAASNAATAATANAGGDVSGPFSNLQIVAGAVGSNEIADLSIVSGDLANSAVVGGKLANNAVTSIKISDGTITAADLNQMGATTGQYLRWSGTAWVPTTPTTYAAGTGISLASNVITNTGDLSSTNELQELLLQGTSLTISQGLAPVSLANFLDNTDGQTLSIAGQTLTISGGNSVNLPSGSANTVTAGTGIAVTSTGAGPINYAIANTAFFQGSGAITAGTVAAWKLTNTVTGQNWRMGATDDGLWRVWNDGGGVSGIISDANGNMSLDNAAPLVSLDISGKTDAIALPSGTIAQRYTATNLPSIRYNSEANGLEYVNGANVRRLTSQTAPIVSVGGAAGSGASVSVIGNDLAGIVTITTGTTPTTGVLFSITYSTAFSTSYPVLSPNTATAATINNQCYVSSSNSSGFSMTAFGGLTGNTQYKFLYHIGQ